MSPCVAIDFSSLNGGAGYWFQDPVRIIQARQGEVADALQFVQRFVDAGCYAAGFVSYTAAAAIDPDMRVREDAQFPDLWFGIFEAPILPEHTSEKVPVDLKPWRPDVSEAEYANAVTNILEAIAAGDTYQVNYTLRLLTNLGGDDFALYERLRSQSQSRYSAYVNTGRYSVLSVSPELFFDRRGDTITVKPMKGTVKRGRWPAEDLQLREWLRSSEKNRAENVMIVDLMRNDLGRIAEFGSVQVQDLCEIETYRTVHQMVSTVSATLRRDYSLSELLQALFPSGSVTGAPKISSMKIIHALEQSSRKVYCGAVGILLPERRTIFNVAIRTLVFDRSQQTLECGVGGAIVSDSSPAEEYEEALLKSKFTQIPPQGFKLFETMLLQEQEFFLQERHLERIQNSALYFGFPLDAREAQRRLSEVKIAHPQGTWRVRLSLDENGALTIEVFELPKQSKERLPVCVCPEPVSSSDIFLYHKTTRRDVYERRRTLFPQMFDVILMNEKGELTEFSIGNLVAEIDGHFWTPPVEAGLLPGVYRQELLDAQVIREKTLVPIDLAHASELWLINSVRKWVPVFLA